MKQTDPWYATFHSCMYGGSRAKSTTIAGSMQRLVILSVDCDRQHIHLPWGKTTTGCATAEEAEYPRGLCIALAQVVQQELGLSSDVQPLVSRTPNCPMKVYKNFATTNVRILVANQLRLVHPLKLTSP